MERGYLSSYFSGIAYKKLSNVEADTTMSNQHEYNGDGALKALLGTGSGRKTFTTKFLYAADDEFISSDGFVTWYDARERHPTRSEWRLYYNSSDVSGNAVAGDSLFICRQSNDDLLVIISEKDSSIESQLNWLFDISDEHSARFQYREIAVGKIRQTDFVVRQILENIGIEIVDENTDYLQIMLDKFGESFPTTREFSEFARSTITEVNALEEPDKALIDWIEREEMLFRVMEKHLISKRIEEGFVTTGEIDVDMFVRYSLSVQNRRKSRVGQALEHHVEQVLKESGVVYSRTPVTENRSKPDFLFPGIEAYNDLSFPENYLSVLGVKSTCKDRWRQVLAEAERIEKKHLLTLEPAISMYQTAEMRSKNLQLVIPLNLHVTYNLEQRDWLFSFSDFIKMTLEKQKFIRKL